ncbi:MAG: sugar phosphate isomerase/epimerase [Armatimonadetes bacterium]|nr:sugar phosphate isomerase/epimerase [Armatimonadota bacterium]MDW8121636.1 sugar phosphate isomerase/epimerase [Armatimonadota bacterium]
MKWRLGLQSYSLRAMPFPQAVAKVKEAGLEFVEGFPGHLPMEKAEEGKKILQEHGVRMIAYGVCRLTSNEPAMRQLFEFAKGMGIEVLTADPDPDSFSLLDRLVEEYGVKVAIHNHGPGSRYPGVDSVVKAYEGHHSFIGLCYDSGHGARAGDDVVAAVRKAGSRLYGVHLKDVNAQKHDVVVGEGVLDLKGFFTALVEVGFAGALMLEYELDPQDPMPGIRQSLDFVKKTTAQLA